MEKHRIQISSDLYNDIYNYCQVNGLKVSEFCENLLKNLFLQEKYGDIPYGEINSNIPPLNSTETTLETQPLKDKMSHITEFLKEGDREMGDIIEGCGGSIEYSKVIDECIYGEKTDKTQKIVEEKPKKRRLK